MVFDENHIDPCGCLNGVFGLEFHNLDVHNLPKCICNLSGGTEKDGKVKFPRRLKLQLQNIRDKRTILRKILKSI